MEAGGSEVKVIFSSTVCLGAALSFVGPGGVGGEAGGEAKDHWRNDIRPGSPESMLGFCSIS